MINGVQFWNDRKAYYSQSNNPTEAFLKATLNDRSGWLETCGPTSAVNCLAAMGKNVEIVCPGEYRPQPEEVLMDYFNDPRNKSVLSSIRKVDDSIPENRVPQFYPLAIYAVFMQLASFRWSLTFSDIVRHVTNGCAVQICLKVPGHYLAVVAYDTNEKELIYNDSWGERFPDGKGGWHRRMGWEEFANNVQNYFIVYGV